MDDLTAPRREPRHRHARQHHTDLERRAPRGYRPASWTGTTSRSCRRSRAGAPSRVGGAPPLGRRLDRVAEAATALEDAVGARLVIRSGRELQWTPEGRLALATAERVDEQVTELGRSVHAAKTGVSSKVTRVSCTPATLVLLSAIVGMARERFPELVVELSGQITPANLAKGEADIALRAFKPDARSRRASWRGRRHVRHRRGLGRRRMVYRRPRARDHPVILYGSALRDIAGHGGSRTGAPRTRGRSASTPPMRSPTRPCPASGSGSCPIP